MKIRNHKYLLTCFFIIGSFFLSAQQNSLNKDSVPEQQKLYDKALALMDSSKWESALPLLKKATKVKKDFWEAHYKMAVAHDKLGDHKAALKSLDAAQKIAPEAYDMLKLRGIIYFKTEKFSEAKKMLDTAAVICEDEKLEDAELYYYRALLMFKGKSYKQAIETCESALEWKPKYVEVFVLKGEIRFTMKEYNYAIRELSTAIDLMGENPVYKAYRLRAISRFEVGDYKNSVKDWNVYIENMPREEEAFILRGAAKININDNSGAIADLDEAIKMNGKNPVSYCYRGVARGGNKNFEGALQDLDYSIKLKFDYSTAFVNRAAIKMARRDKMGACADLEKADGLGNQLALKLIQQYCKQ